MSESGTPPTTQAPGRPGRTGPVRGGFSLLSDDDIYLFNEGRHFGLYHKLGAHPLLREGQAGTFFAVWAPNAAQVSVIGEFNRWDKTTHLLLPRAESGIFEGFIPGVGQGDLYKYHLVSRQGGYRVDKADPLAFFFEAPPRTASCVWELDYDWQDRAWLESRAERRTAQEPVSVYEVHLGSWQRPDGDQGFLGYRELAPRLADYLEEMAFTHVELLPVMEHPFYGSWGYQPLGYFAPSHRYGGPQDLMYLIDLLHQRGIGVILDWVPAHFPSDEHGLGYFDGTHLYEHADPKKGFHPDWKSLIFNYGRNEVRSFLISSALFWLDKYHADGLRVDAVASMLYLDYSRQEGEWVPNRYGGRENLEAIDFLRQLNVEIYRTQPGVETVAEESTSWPMVSKPTYLGGLGFGMKWDMGWMHDTLSYISLDPILRKFHHDKLTFRAMYAFSENFVLPLSHDEVVHGKGSLMTKIFGDKWQKLAGMRLLLAHMYSQPGKKLLFMGTELGQWREWDHDRDLDWDLLAEPLHAGLKRWTAELNRLYRGERSLHGLDFQEKGFQWIDCNDAERSVLTVLRQEKSGREALLVSLNFTPVPRHNYRVGAPWGGFWKEVLNSDAREYGGSGQGNLGGVEATPVPFHGRFHSLNLTLPPLGAVFLKGERPDEP